jgi:hypothetical protein
MNAFASRNATTSDSRRVMRSRRFSLREMQLGAKFSF